MIKKIKYKDHAILGNIELDFSKPDGSIYNTIILAGFNGSGKTTILETLASVLNCQSLNAFDYIIYDANDVSYKLTAGETVFGSELGFHKRQNLITGETKDVRSNRNNHFQLIENDLEDIRHYGFAYSKARSGFQANKISSTNTLHLDSEKYEPDISDDFTSIKQLIVNIDAQDNSDWRDIFENGGQGDYSVFNRQSRMARFKNAFNNFFEDIKFKKVDRTADDELKIVFEKHGKPISIDNLSTGEKQIVFRGAYLLRNLRNVEHGIILIDEPELSLHPQWQQKILQYYRNLFTTNGVQTAQIIIATHSEYVLSSALTDSENVLVITLKDENGNIQCEEITTPYALPSITSAEINYKAFNIYSTDYHIALYGHLQNITGNDKIGDCDRFIANQPEFIEAKHGKTLNNGRDHYKTLPTYIRNLIDHPRIGESYTIDELKISTELLIQLCQRVLSERNQ